MTPARPLHHRGERGGETLAHDGTSTLAKHVANLSRRRVRVKDDDDDTRTRYVFVKTGAGKIDGCIAAVLAFEAASSGPTAKARIVNTAQSLGSTLRPTVSYMTRTLHIGHLAVLCRQVRRTGRKTAHLR
jgi:hypothetical protein